MKSFLITLMLVSGIGLSAQAHNGAQELARGSFAPVDTRHQIMGDIDIVREADGLHLMLENNFNVTHGPDLRVVLRDSRSRTAMIIVAPLSSFQGAQDFVLPLNEEMLRKFDEVVIYCAKYHVDFGVANFQLP